ncbi:MAG: C40 family peptidase [bacterium]
MQEDKPYVLGGQDPKVGFDCSGLVVWAYGKVISNILFLREGRIVSDVEVEYLYSENTTPLKLGDIVPGDIVFIANKNGIVNHCGLIVSTDSDSIKIIHASGGLGKVTIEDWKIGEEIRGGHIHSFGRLKIMKTVR